MGYRAQEAAGAPERLPCPCLQPGGKAIPALLNAGIGSPSEVNFRRRRGNGERRRKLETVEPPSALRQGRTGRLPRSLVLRLSELDIRLKPDPAGPSGRRRQCGPGVRRAPPPLPLAAAPTAPQHMPQSQASAEPQAGKTEGPMHSRHCELLRGERAPSPS